MATIDVNTGEVPIVTGALRKSRRPSRWKRLFRRRHEKQKARKERWKWRKRPEDIPQPKPIIQSLTLSQVRERSAYGVAERRATQKLTYQPRTDEIELESIIPLNRL